MTDSTPPVPPVPPAPPASAAPEVVVPPAPNPYAQPAAPNPYAPPAASNPYAAPYAPGQYAPRTNTLAIVGFILSFVISVAGVICSHIALSQIKRTGEGGHGLALAGVIIGYVVTGFWLLYFIGIIAIIVISAASGSSNF